jgi:hypothetical protein
MYKRRQSDDGPCARSRDEAPNQPNEFKFSISGMANSVNYFISAAGLTGIAIGKTISHLNIDSGRIVDLKHA